MLIIYGEAVRGCNDVLVQSKTGFVHARTMDFHIQLDVKFVSIPQNTEFKSFDSSANPALSWSTRYAYAGLSSVVMAPNDVLDGMNEKGLSIAVLWLEETRFPKKALGENAIQSTRLVSYLLGMCQDVDEVKKSFETIKVWGEFIHALEMPSSVHLSCADRMGRSLVIEFLEERIMIHDNEYRVLTNDPSFLKMSFFCKEQRAQSDSIRRFINASNFVKSKIYQTQSDSVQAVQSFFKPMWNPPYTQWYFIKDLQNGIFYFCSDNNRLRIYNIGD